MFSYYVCSRQEVKREDGRGGFYFLRTHHRRRPLIILRRPATLATTRPTRPSLDATSAGTSGRRVHAEDAVAEMDWEGTWCSIRPGPGWATTGVIGCPNDGILRHVRYNFIHLARVWFLKLVSFWCIFSFSSPPPSPIEAVFSRRASLAISDGALLGGKGRHERGRLERPSDKIVRAGGR
jgi:hypothetical protein